MSLADSWRKNKQQQHGYEDEARTARLVSAIQKMDYTPSLSEMEGSEVVTLAGVSCWYPKGRWDRLLNKHRDGE